jgi:hypothetical protein
MSAKGDVLEQARRHAKWAKKHGKCEQCQHPDHDGICSCGKWGEAEKRMAAILIKAHAAKERVSAKR